MLSDTNSNASFPLSTSGLSGVSGVTGVSAGTSAYSTSTIRRQRKGPMKGLTQPAPPLAQQLTAESSSYAPSGYTLGKSSGGGMVKSFTDSSLSQMDPPDNIRFTESPPSSPSFSKPPVPAGSQSPSKKRYSIIPSRQQQYRTNPSRSYPQPQFQNGQGGPGSAYSSSTYSTTSYPTTNLSSIPNSSTYEDFSSGIASTTAGSTIAPTNMSFENDLSETSEYFSDGEAGEQTLIVSGGPQGFGVGAANGGDGCVQGGNPDETDAQKTDAAIRLLQRLCDNENGFDLLLDRIKQGIHSSKDVVTFLRKRAAIEEDYAKSMMKLAQAMSNPKSSDSVKEGSYGEGWGQFCKIHERVGEIRQRLATDINEIADELSTAQKNAERSRKQLKEAGQKSWKSVQESETALEKTKQKYDQTSEDWERAILLKEEHAFQSQQYPLLQAQGVNVGTGSVRRGIPKSASNPISLWMQASGGYSSKSANPAKLHKHEEETRNRAAIANEHYKLQLQKTNTVRHDYFFQQLPGFLRELKETNDECDKSLRRFMLDYCEKVDMSMYKEVRTLCGGPAKEGDEEVTRGLADVVQSIDSARDFESFMDHYMEKQRHGNQGQQKGEYKYSPYAMSPEAISIINPKPIFGEDLTYQLERDNLSTPLIVTKCIQAIENTPGALKSPGLYRVSGTQQLVHKLRAMFDRDAEKVDLSDWVNDINNITGVLKQYFRELPDPLFTRALYRDFLEASKIEEDRVRLVQIHELVNQLPDAHYATLRDLMAHLWKVQQNESENKMGIANLSIIWGPTLMDGPPAATRSSSEISSMAGSADITVMMGADMKYQSKVVEIVLANFNTIFEA
ncbi:hypothetical protein HK102_012447 [Quaeritorhiza haematococci]|nr:hypothetical protein HK102_012447 [Quaeritorhiza haematococci]